MRKNILFVSIYLLSSLFLCSTLLQANCLAEEPTCLTKGWPSDRSDLKPDPAISRGILPNGLRYIVYPNNEPENRVAIYLNIQAGSFHEAEEQRGIAHFLEHMLFNGTTNFQAGELVQFFQSIGMSFGGDTNAHTTFDETVYKILLPDGSEENLRNGMLVLSDFSRGALLNEREIERERGVILAEKTARDSAAYRAFVAGNRFVMKGTLMPERLVIGTESVLKSADRPLMKRYYDSWYRPDNMLLVVVGDTDSESVRPLIEEYFGHLAAGQFSGTCPDFGSVENQGLEAFYYHEPDLGRTDVTIQSVWDTTPQDDSFQFQVEELLRYAGILMMRNRLQKKMEQAEVTFTDSGYSSGEMFDKVGYAAITARTEPEKWQETQREIHRMLKKALRFGFREDELEVVKKDLMASLESAVLTRESRKTSYLATAIIHQFNDNRVMQSPEQELDLYSKIVREITLAQVNSQFRKGWEHDSRIVSVSGNAQLDEKRSREIIRDLYLATERSVVEEPQKRERKTFPYLDVPEREDNGVVRALSLDLVGGERRVLSNNVVLSLKSTDFESNKIRIVVSIGHGKNSEPVPGASLIAEKVVNNSGTRHLSLTEFSDVLAGSTIDARFSIAEDSFRFRGSAITQDSELLMQVLYTLIADPALRDEAYTRALKSLKQMYDRLETDINGALPLQVDRFLAGGDPRIGLPPWEAVSSVSLAQLRTWLMPALAQESIEVSIVGDFDYSEMADLAAKYFGALGIREGSDTEFHELSFPEGGRLVKTVQTKIAKSMVLTAWPTTDMWNIQLTRRLNVLAGVFRERLRKVVREKLGATYSPVVYSSPARIYKNYGKLVAQVIVAPGKEKEVLEEIAAIAEDMNRGTVSVEEMQNIIRPLLTSLKESVRSNRYWLSTVLDQSVKYPQQLEWSTTMEADYAGITVEEINQLARKYLMTAKSAEAVVKPASADKGKAE